jgi:hypothetical protein
MHRKFAAIQQNHQNSILFHETILLLNLYIFVTSYLVTNFTHY